MSKAGKVTLVKSVVQAIPLYSMSSFKWPLASCKALDSMIRRFWWGVHPDKHRFLALRAWSDICKPKEVGGLGFRKFSDINAALLAKLG